VVTRRLDPVLPLDAAREAVGHLTTFPIVPIDRPLVLRAIETAQRDQLGLWDAQIVEAAVAAGCETIITEGLNAGQAIRGVEIVNPFKDVT
jgi:predicted nucleic acid-binding protein